jgi:hypothetical protein
MIAPWYIILHLITPIRPIQFELNTSVHIYVTCLKITFVKTWNSPSIKANPTSNVNVFYNSSLNSFLSTLLWHALTIPHLVHKIRSWSTIQGETNPNKSNIYSFFLTSHLNKMDGRCVYMKSLQHHRKRTHFCKTHMASNVWQGMNLHHQQKMGVTLVLAKMNNPSSFHTSQL